MCFFGKGLLVIDYPALNKRYLENINVCAIFHYLQSAFTCTQFKSILRAKDIRNSLRKRNEQISIIYFLFLETLRSSDTWGCAQCQRAILQYV